MSQESPTRQQLLQENEELRNRLSEVEDTLEAIRSGAVDALVLSDEHGERIFSLQSVDYSYRVMVENMNEGAIVLNKNGTIVFSNKVFSAMSGMEMSTIVGNHFIEYLPKALHAGYSGFLKESLHHPCRREFAIISPSKGLLPVFISATLFNVGAERNVCMIITDLSEQKKAEQKVQTAYEEVEKKVQERTAELQKANGELSKSREILRAIIESTPDFIYMKDTEGRYVTMNSAAVRAIGKPLEAIIGFRDSDIFPADIAGTIAQDDQRIITEKETRTFDEPFMVGNERRTLLTTKNVCRGPDGAVIGLVGFSRDITDRKRTEEKLRWQSMILDQVQEAIIFRDDEFRIQYLNKKAYEQYEIDSDAKIIGSKLGEFFQYEWLSPEQEKDAFEELRRSGSWRGELIQVTNKKKRIWVDAVIKVLQDSEGRRTGSISAIRDITDRKNMEYELRDRAEELASANRELESFAYSISHDLRAPLRVLRGFSDILLEEYINKLDTEGQEYLRRIVRGAEKMSELIEDMLKLAKISRQEMAVREIDLSALADSIVNELRQAEPERKIQAAIARGLRADGDERLMRIALSNLIGNAWKYSSKTPDARIEFGVIEKCSEKVYYVQDNGAGFDMKQATKLFAPFQRLHPESQFPGTGIGLAIVKRVIERHAGRIWAESGVGKGAIFFFILPVREGRESR